MDLLESVVVGIFWAAACVLGAFLLMVLVIVGLVAASGEPIPAPTCYGTGCDVYIPLPPPGYPLGIR